MDLINTERVCPHLMDKLQWEGDYSGYYIVKWCFTILEDSSQVLFPQILIGQDNAFENWFSLFGRCAEARFQQPNNLKGGVFSLLVNLFLWKGGKRVGTSFSPQPNYLGVVDDSSFNNGCSLGVSLLCARPYKYLELFPFQKKGEDPLKCNFITPIMGFLGRKE